jgi:hypothetical protein
LRAALRDLLFYDAALPGKGGDTALELMNLTIPDAGDGRILNAGCFEILGHRQAGGACELGLQPFLGGSQH